MNQQDYIKREIEKIGRMMLAILKKLEDPNNKMVQLDIKDSRHKIGEAIGLDILNFLTQPKQSMVQSLNDAKIDASQYFLLSKYLYTEALHNELPNQKIDFSRAAISVLDIDEETNHELSIERVELRQNLHNLLIDSISP